METDSFLQHRCKANETPLVSIIIPCYNGESFIENAIDSIINQTFQYWELIIVDDGSTDRSKAVIRPYLQDPRIRFFEHATNKGIPQTRNRGLSEARGDYVAFMDQDDTWLPDKLELQIAGFDSSGTEIGAVCTGMKMVDTKNRLLDAFTGFDDRNHRNLIRQLYLSPIHSSSIMMTRRDIYEKIGSFNETLKGWDDYELLMRIGVDFPIRYIRKPLVVKTLHGNNAQNRPDIAQEADRVFQIVLNMHPWLKATEKMKASRRYINRAKQSLDISEKTAARKSLAMAIRLDPTGMRPILLFFLVCLTGTAALRILKTANRISGSIKLLRFLSPVFWESKSNRRNI